MSNMLKRYRWWIALMVLLLAGGSLSSGIRAAQAQTGQLSEDDLTRAELATVQIYILDPKSKPLGTCTGTFQTATGIILTNFHCVGHTDLYGADDTGLGLSNGDFYNPKGLVVIAPTKSEREVPKPTYIAQVVASNPNIDIAVVKIVGMLKDGQKLPTNLPIVPIKRADSDKVKVRDFVGVLGYPGVGGPLLTYTEGQVAGFEDQNEDSVIDAFKTTANINPGNSGGLAVNNKGEQIGIPTYGVSEGASKIDRIKMVNIATPYINQAIKGGGDPVTLEGTSPTDPKPPVGNDPAPADNGVILTGKIIDANTKKGVPGALLIILQPGVAFEQFQSSGFDESLVATVGTADRNGKYQTSPGLERDKTYTVVIGAKGYTPRVFEDGLEITSDDADVTSMEDIAIQKQ